MAHTTRTTLDRPTAGRTLHVSSFDQVRSAVRSKPAPEVEARKREIGSAPARDPRRDLQMFDPLARPAVLAVRCGALAPLLPPVISEPGRPRYVAAPAPAVARRPRREPRAIAQPPMRARLRLTLRGYGALLGLAVGAIAGVSAISTAGAQSAATVTTTEVVAQAGETAQQIAERSAQGRDIAELAEAIERANGLADGAALRPGEIVIVPGA